MALAEFNHLPRRERAHFDRCSVCDEYFDRRDLGAVVFHCFEGHKPIAEVPYKARVRMVGSLPNEPVPSADDFRLLSRPPRHKSSSEPPPAPIA